MSGETLPSISHPAAAAAAAVRGLSIFQSLFSRSGFGDSMHRTCCRCCTWELHSLVSAGWQDQVLSVPLCIPNHANYSSPSHLMPTVRATSKDRIFSCTDLCAHARLHHPLSRLWRSPRPLLAHISLYACRCSPASPGLLPGKWVIVWKATARSCAYYLHLCLSHAPPTIYTGRSLANVIKTR